MTMTRLHTDKHRAPVYTDNCYVESDQGQNWADIRTLHSLKWLESFIH